MYVRLHWANEQKRFQITTKLMKKYNFVVAATPTLLLLLLLFGVVRAVVVAGDVLHSVDCRYRLG